MPAADTVGVAAQLVDWVLSVRPDLFAPLCDALALDVDDAAELARVDGTAYDTVLLVVAAAYYHHPQVRDAIGYRGQEAQAFDPREYPQYIAEGLLDHLVESS